MAARKLKLPAQPLPQSRDEADRLFGQIVELERWIEEIDAGLARDVAALTETARALVAPKAASRDAKVKALAAWAEASKSTLLDGERRSVALAHGTIGWRRTPPRVVVDEGQDDAVIAALERRPSLRDLLRVTTALNKEAILADPKRIAGVAGIAVKGGEIFFAQPRDIATELQLARGRVKRATVPTENQEDPT